MALPIHTSAGARSRARVTIEQRTAVDSGFPIDTWTPLLVGVWMQRIDLLGNEAFRADQLSARYDVLFIGPYHPSLDPELLDVPATQRLVARDRVYDIAGAVTVGHFEGIEYRVLAHTGGE